MSDTAAPIRHAPFALWRVAQAFLGTLHMLFGAPEDVAREHTLVADAHKRLASWLRCAEALLRRLLVIEASAFPKPNTRPLLISLRTRVRKLMSFDADKPEKWRVSFRCFVGDTHAPGVLCSLFPTAGRACVSPTHTRRLEAGGPRRFRSAWPLAERYEALIRVFNDPAPYARRLARRLHATPHRLCEALRAPKEAPHRVEGFDAMGERSRAAWRPYFSSA